MKNYTLEFPPDDGIYVVRLDEYLRGERGYSAYEVAVKNGFAGTEAEWLASLNGSGDAVNEKTISCTPGDWVLSDGYYVLNVGAGVHMLGFNARVSGAENYTEGLRDAVVSYNRLPDGTVLIYSHTAFTGKIFLKG